MSEPVDGPPSWHLKPLGEVDLPSVIEVGAEGQVVRLEPGESARVTMVRGAANLSLGLLISTVAKTQFQAMQMTFFVLLPSILLSGFMFPFDGMPEPAQWIAEVLPMTHFMRMIRGVVLRGADLHDLSGELGILGVFILIVQIGLHPDVTYVQIGGGVGEHVAKDPGQSPEVLVFEIASIRPFEDLDGQQVTSGTYKFIDKKFGRGLASLAVSDFLSVYPYIHG
mgnify:CR=1 FL=1